MVAATFGFSAGEVLAMDLDDLEFWLREAKWINNPR